MCPVVLKHVTSTTLSSLIVVIEIADEQVLSIDTARRNKWIETVEIWPKKIKPPAMVPIAKDLRDNRWQPEIKSSPTK